MANLRRKNHQHEVTLPENRYFLKLWRYLLTLVQVRNRPLDCQNTPPSFLTISHNFCISLNPKSLKLPIKLIKVKNN